MATSPKPGRRNQEPASELSNERGEHLLFATLALSFATLSCLAAFADSFLLRLDAPVDRAVVGIREGWATDALTAVTYFGSSPFVWGLLLVFTLWAFLIRRCRIQTVALLLSYGAILIIKTGLKAAIDRPRPEMARLIEVSGSSFPSGHTLSAVWFFGMFALALWQISEAAWARIAAVGVAVTITLGIAFSRLYLGGHWLTDALGSFLLGGALILANDWSLRRFGLAPGACMATPHGRSRAAPSIT